MADLDVAEKENQERNKWKDELQQQKRNEWNRTQTIKHSRTRNREIWDEPSLVGEGAGAADWAWAEGEKAANSRATSNITATIYLETAISFFPTERKQANQENPKSPENARISQIGGPRGIEREGGEEEEEFKYGRRMTQNYAIYSPSFESRTRENIENATKDHMVDNDMWSGRAQSIILTLLKVDVHPVWIGMFWFFWTYALLKVFVTDQRLHF